MRRTIVSLCLFALFLACTQAGQAQSSATPAALPRVVNFSGTINNADGSPRTGVVGITFALYKEQQGGTALWQEIQNVQLDAAGHYTVLLGSTHEEGLPREVFTSNEARWLGVQVESETEQPRVPLVAVPYTLKAGDAETLGGRPASAYVLTPEAQAAASSTSTAPSTSTTASGTGSKSASKTTASDITPLGSFNYVAKFDIFGSLVNSQMVDNGSYVTVGSTNANGMYTGYLYGRLRGDTLYGNQYNTAVGTYALNANVSGISNTAVGYNAAPATTGGYNSAFGLAALLSNTTGNANTGTGISSLHDSTTGGYNTGSGYWALGANTTGNYNTGVGSYAGVNHTTGTFNTFIGYGAGLGTGTQLTNATAIGANALVSASDSLVLGSGVNVGIGTSTPGFPLTVMGGGGAHKIAVVGPAGANVLSTFVQGTNKRASLFINSAGAAVLEGWEDGVGPLNFAMGPAGGNVGIGTSTPSFPLTVTGGGPHKIAVIGPAGSNVLSTFVQGTTQRASLFINSDKAAVLEGWEDGVGPLNFALGPAGGNVGIGTSTPAQKLTVNGSASISGNLSVSGTLTKGAGSFKIDHPLDPANMYLSHSFVESPDMKNVYDGVAVLDKHGEAWVRLPDYFEVLNRDFRYQLTCVGGYAPVYIAQKISGNRFKIAGGRRGLEVSWQVTGTRQDAYANAHRIPVEEKKPAAERGTYLNPDLFQHATGENTNAAWNH